MSIYKDSTRSIDERVADLLSQMSLDEKIAQLAGVWITDMIDSQRAFLPDKAAGKIPHGIGHISRIGAASLLKPAGSAALANQIQRYLIENTRLGIPGVVHEESCAGYLARGATTFPQAIGLGASWEPELIEEMTKVIRLQMRAVGAHHTLAPVLDVARDARWGRVEETFGEDPYLISRMGCAYIKGIQNDDLRQGIAATAKHFVGYAMSEGGMNWAPAHISLRELWDVYLLPFLAAIQETKVATVMNAYHEMDGIPCGASKELLTDILRGQMGFDGVLVSDYFTINALYTYHGIAHNAEEAAQIAMEAGIDIELPALDCYGEPLRRAVEQGKVSMALIDTAVSRGLRIKFELGLFEQPYVDAGYAPEVFNTPEQRALSLKLAQKSMVLLKNVDNLLPLPANLESVAVIGPSADSIRALQGDYHYPSHMEGVFIADVNMDSPNPMQDIHGDSILDHFPPSVSVLEGIKQTVSSQTKVYYAQGCELIGNDTSGFEEAIQAAKKAKVAIVVVGEKSGLAKGCTTGESIDRADVGLPGVQQQLVEAIYATGTPVIVVLTNGRPLAIPWIAEHVPAVLVGWLPAQEGGTAIADVLFGVANPGGKLPMSFPRSSAQIPVFYSHKPSGGRSHWHGDYCDMPTSPQFPFGHGLSYTCFEYSNLSISPDQVGAHDTVTISLDVKNIGSRQGDEVVQLYLHDCIGSVTRPVKELKGFIRLTLQPQESQTVTFHVPAAQIGFLNLDMAFVVEPGQVEVMVGSSSEDIRLSGQFEITGPVTPVDRVFVTPVEVKSALR
ncbi:MAG: glycoside hydrolase family 3 C-terminal domain-containing protein [Chloroflexi bacterium]|nr:glycoside hydrolase family 3 C-terminal domain-containing protein [Chloroflexota bacterium]